MERLIPADRDQLLLLPPSLQEWVPKGHFVHFLTEAVESMPLPALKVNSRGTGDAQYPPKMMLEILIYCYAQGIFSSRKIERATWQDVIVRYLSANTHPDHDTIAKFRKENFEAISHCFVEVLKLAKEMKLLKVGTVSVDGTKLKANASKDKSIRYDRAMQLEAQLESEVRALLHKAETADNMQDEDGSRLPEELQRLSALKEKMQKARRNIEERARKDKEQAQKEYEAKKAAFEEKNRGGNPPQPPSDEVPPTMQTNLTDADSRLMRPNLREGFLQGYNAQACVDAEGSQLILGHRISQCASDAHELMPTMGAIPFEAGKVQAVLADKGFASRETFEALERQAIEGYVAVQSEACMQERRHDFRPPKTEPAKAKILTSPWNVRMAEKLKTEAGRRLYRLRKQTVEPVFGIIKQAMGFRQFTLRGLRKVEGEWSLVCLAYNLRRLHTLSRA